jgi:hypothetical protein
MALAMVSGLMLSVLCATRPTGADRETELIGERLRKVFKNHRRLEVLESCCAREPATRTQTLNTTESALKPGK